VTDAQKQAPGRSDDIVSATIDFITESGVGQLRAADIAKRLGVSTGLIFYHFGTLEKLIVQSFEVAAERDLDQLRDLLDSVAGQPAREKLEAVLRQYGPTGKAQGWRLWIESWSASLRHPELRKVVMRLDARWRQTVAMLIAEGVGAGEFTTPDVQGAALRLTTMLDGLAVQAVAFDGAVGDTEIQRWIDEAMRRELNLPPN